MSDWIEVSAHPSGQWLYLLALPALLLLAFSIYKRTEPAVSALVLKALWILRGTTLVFVLLLLIDPVVGLTGKRAALPLLIALVDTSPSMAITMEDGSSRLDHVTRLMETNFFQSRQKFEAWGFAEAPYRLSLDTLGAVIPRGRGTDISRALTVSLDQAADAEVAGIILFSDGRHNLGGDPVAAISRIAVPVFACAAGETEFLRDVSITPVDSDAPVFVGDSFRLDVELGSTGVREERIELSLSEDGVELSRQELVTPRSPSGETSVQGVSFQVTATTPGPHIYHVTTPVLEGEQARHNNDALAFVRVRQQRIRVHLAAASPSLDYTFLRRALLADSTLLLTDRLAALRSKGEPLPVQLLPGEADVVILVDPDRDLVATIGESVAQHVRSGGGLLFVAGPKSAQALKAGTSMNDLLPFDGFSAARFAETEIRLTVAPAGRTHPVTRVVPGSQPADADSPWRALPPLPGYLAGVRLRSHSHLLMSGLPAVARTGSVAGPTGGVPIIAVRTHGPGRVMATASAAFWRLDFTGPGTSESAHTVQRLWRNAVKWLAAAGSGGRVRASTDRQVYRTGEDVSIVTEVSDDLLRPESDADVEVVLSRDGQEGEGSTFLGAVEAGRYRGRFEGLGPGEYSYRAEARLPGKLIGSHEGQFVVVEQTVESLNMRPDFSHLREIARASGGQFLPPGSCGDMATFLDTSPKLVQEESVIALRGGMWPLGLLICLLSAEWLLRKRVGML